MAKHFKCAFCEYVAHGETDEEILEDIARHNRERHNMEMTEEIRKKVLAGIEED
ncbi:MAG: DUF1059 domain-containing protein [Anaerolineae bacterium]|jgi:predicted small metal-binding protein